MKHNFKITALLLAMFLVTQLIGLFVVNNYLADTAKLPYGMEPPEDVAPRSVSELVLSFAIAFAVVVVIMLLLTKYRAETFLRIWFFIVVILAMGITLTSLAPTFKYASVIAFVIALPLAFFKIFKRNLIVHNITELFVYPGIAAIFVVMLISWTNASLIAISVILILISLYDMYAVWHAGFMQKMAQYQIQKLKLFTGFFVPYIGAKERQMIAKAKRSKSKKTKNVKVGVAILGGGDIVFPIIMAGIVLMKLGLLPALSISVFATAALAFLFYVSEKGKFYPAMPFISIGCFLGLLVGWLI